MNVPKLPTATRQAALQAAQTFLPNAGRQYAKNRNFDFGPDERDNVSVLSPYVRHRLLTEEELLRSVLDCHRFADAQKFVEEVYWRTYFKGWMEHHPDVWANYHRDLGRLVRRLNDDADACERYNEAVSGSTGIDCFDAWIDELVTTGYLHNHARMWFASIWVYTLGLPWQLGADFFLRHLIDGDPASNTLGWRWVCGLHTRGKTYLARVSNIANFTNYRFNPRGQLATHAPPLSEDAMIHVQPPEPAGAEPDGEFGLIVTEEDCVPELGLLSRRPAAAMGVTATNDRSLLPVSPLVYDFARHAVEDALARAGAAYDCPTGFAGDGDWVAATLAFCEEHSLEALVTPWAPTGPAATRLASLESALDDAGVALIRLRRDYDEDAWPYAGRGYFKLKRQVPELLGRLGIEAELRDTA